MLARDEIVSLLQGDGVLSDDVEVIGYARNIDPPRKPTVMVRIDAVRPSQAAGGLWQVDAALVLIGTKTTPGPADDELDALLQDVLLGLDLPALDGITWSEAKRALYGDPDPTNPAYEIAVSIHLKKEN